MSQQITTATNQASVMHAIIHAWYMSGHIALRLDRISGLWTPRTTIYWIFTVPGQAYVLALIRRPCSPPPFIRADRPTLNRIRATECLQKLPNCSCIMTNLLSMYDRVSLASSGMASHHAQIFHCHALFSF